MLRFPRRGLLVPRVCLLVAAALALLCAPQALAHSWYDPDCCGDNDCEPIPSERITFLDDGNMRMRDSKGVDWLVEMGDGARAEVPPRQSETQDPAYDAWRRHREAFGLSSRPTKRRSQDGAHHLCIWAGRVHCVYLPAGG